MRKIILIVIFILFLITLVNNEKEEEIRVRIIPNSNSEDDLVIKENVKDAVVYYLYCIYSDNYEVYKDNINDSLYDLKRIIDKEDNQ